MFFCSPSQWWASHPSSLPHSISQPFHRRLRWSRLKFLTNFLILHSGDCCHFIHLARKGFIHTFIIQGVFLQITHQTLRLLCQKRQVLLRTVSILTDLFPAVYRAPVALHLHSTPQKGNERVLCRGQSIFFQLSLFQSVTTVGAQLTCPLTASANIHHLSVLTT